LEKGVEGGHQNIISPGGIQKKKLGIEEWRGERRNFRSMSGLSRQVGGKGGGDPADMFKIVLGAQ